MKMKGKRLLKLIIGVVLVSSLAVGLPLMGCAPAATPAPELAPTPERRACAGLSIA